MGADPSVEQEVSRRRPGPHGVAWASWRVAGQTLGEPAQSASFGLALAAIATSSSREVEPAQGSSRPVWSALLVSSARRHASKILKADHDEAAVSKAATPMWLRAVAMATVSGAPVVGRLGDRSAVAGQPMHRLEMAILRRDQERGALSCLRWDSS